MWGEGNVCVEHNQTCFHTAHSDSQYTPSLTPNSCPHPTLILHSHPHLTFPPPPCTSNSHYHFQPHSTLSSSPLTSTLTPHKYIRTHLLLHVLSYHPRLHLHCQVAGVHIKNLVLEHNTHRQSHCSLIHKQHTTPNERESYNTHSSQ